MEEIWKDVISYEGIYEVSNLGRVRSINTGRKKPLKPLLGNNGYFKINLYKDKKMSAINIHRLVAIAFIINDGNKKQVNHIDGNKINNNVDNLEWVTDSENQKHSYDIGLKVGRKGTSHHNCKITEETVIKIRELWNTGEYVQREIAEIIGINTNNVWKIINGVRWKHI